MTAPRRPRPGPAGDPAPPGELAPSPGDLGTPPGEPAPGVDPDPRLPVPLVALGLAGIVLVAALGAVICVLLTPARIGDTLVPVAVVLSVVLNVALPVLTFGMTRSRGVAALPVLVFFVVGWALSISPNGDVLLAGGSDGQTAVSYATLLLAVFAGAVTSVRVR